MCWAVLALVQPGAEGGDFQQHLLLWGLQLEIPCLLLEKTCLLQGSLTQFILLL